MSDPTYGNNLQMRGGGASFPDGAVKQEKLDPEYGDKMECEYTNFYVVVY